MARRPEAAIATAIQWTQWRVPLNSFVGVNAAKAKKFGLVQFWVTA
jgi:hypothetical protein